MYVCMYVKSMFVYVCDIAGRIVYDRMYVSQMSLLVTINRTDSFFLLHEHCVSVCI